MRREVGKSLLTSKYPSITTELNKRATNQHNAELSEWSLVLDNITSAQDIGLCVRLPSPPFPALIDLCLC